MVAPLNLDGVRIRRPSESLNASTAVGRILASDIRADRDSPPFDYSVVDGYALRAADFAVVTGVAAESKNQSAATATHARVIGESRIGHAPPLLLERDDATSLLAIRISTGAPIPPGADVVIKREDVIEHSGEDESARAGVARERSVASIAIPFTLATTLKPRENVRFAGENARAGDVILRAGEPITSASVGALAALGILRPLVVPRLKIAIISTGDELTPTDQPPSPFQIRDSNLPALASLFASRAWADVTVAAHIADDVASLASELTDASRDVDAIVLTGGVSMGHRDPVRAALELAFRDRLQILFHGLPQRPGKPMLGAIAHRDHAAPLPIFGLPGNPVSALVTARRIAIPVLAKRAGLALAPAAPRVAIAKADARTLDLWWHRLVRVSSSGHATLVELRGSGDLIACAQSHGFVEVPPHTALAPAGDASPSLLEYFAWND